MNKQFLQANIVEKLSILLLNLIIIGIIFTLKAFFKELPINLNLSFYLSISSLSLLLISGLIDKFYCATIVMYGNLNKLEKYKTPIEISIPICDLVSGISSIGALIILLLIT